MPDDGDGDGGAGTAWYTPVAGGDPVPSLTWRRAISAVMAREGECWRDVVACTLDDGALDAAFNPSYGAIEGAPFGLWTTRRVYFPVSYDGAEFVASVPRDPGGAIHHVGEGDVHSGFVWSVP